MSTRIFRRWFFVNSIVALPIGVLQLSSPRGGILGSLAILLGVVFLIAAISLQDPTPRQLAERRLRDQYTENILLINRMPLPEDEKHYLRVAAHQKLVDQMTRLLE